MELSLELFKKTRNVILDIENKKEKEAEDK